MLKSLFVSLRKKPKLARDNAAMLLAGGFTFLVFGIWVLALPGRFDSDSVQGSAEVFSSFRDQVNSEVGSFGDATEGLQELSTIVASSTEGEDVMETVLLEDLELTPEEQPLPIGRVARIATTSADTASSTEE